MKEAHGYFYRGIHVWLKTMDALQLSIWRVGIFG